MEQLVVLALSTLETDGEAGLQQLLLAHPDHAKELQRHVGRLHDLGLMADDTLHGTAAADEPTAPEMLGDFRLLQRIGGGGMGVVYEAEQRSLQRRVALKLIRSDHLYFPGARERFRREVDSVARLQHPAIVPVHATGEDSGVPWLAMELIYGASLDEVLTTLADRDPARLRGTDLQDSILLAMRRRGAPRPAAEVTHATSATEETPCEAFAGTWSTACVRLARTIAQALDHAHQRGVLHRDVKPSNIMLTPDGRALLLDFGLARTTGGPTITQTGNLVGTPAYMSPEQVRGDLSSVDRRTDIYSLAVTLHELLTLRSPFAATSTEATRQLVINGVAPPMRSLNGTIAADLETVCRKARDLDPERRYRTADAFAQDLNNVLERRPIAAQPPSTLRTLRRWLQRRPVLATAMLASFLLCFVAPTVLYVLVKAERDHARDALSVALRDRVRARQAVETMLTRVANESLFDMPRMQKVRRDLLSSAKTFHEQFLLDGGDDPELLAETVDSTRDLAILDAELGHTDTAFLTAQRAVELARKLRARQVPPDADADRMAMALMTLAAAQQSQGHLDDAQASFEESIALHQSLVSARPDDARAAGMLLESYRSIALVQRQLALTELASNTYAEMAHVQAALIKQTKGTEDWGTIVVHLIRACCDATEFHIEQRDLEAAQAALANCPQASDLPSAEPDASALLSLSRVELQRSRIAASKGESIARQAHLRQALRVIASLLAVNPDHMNGLRMQALVHNDLATELSASGRDGEAQRALGESIEVLRRLVELDPDAVENSANLGASYTNLASSQQQDGDLQGALASLRLAKPLLTAAIAAVPSRTQWHGYQYNRTWYLGQVLGQLGQHQEQAEVAHALAALRPTDATTQRIAAGLLATAVALVAKDQDMPSEARQLAQTKLEDACLTLLQHAADLGCVDAKRVRTGADFASVSSRVGFAAIVQQIEQNLSRAPIPVGQPPNSK